MIIRARSLASSCASWQSTWPCWITLPTVRCSIEITTPSYGLRTVSMFSWAFSKSTFRAGMRNFSFSISATCSPRMRPCSICIRSRSRLFCWTVRCAMLKSFSDAADSNLNLISSTSDMPPSAASVSIRATRSRLVFMWFSRNFTSVFACSISSFLILTCEL